MATTGHDDGWYLFDYGMVISAAPAAGDWERLHAASGLRLDASGSTYWAHRHAFDAGELDSRGYWSAVLDRDVDADEAERLDRLDARLWSTINPDTAAVLQALRAWGAQLALLSNMPVRMSELFTAEAGWTAWFDRLFFSGPLGMGKPEPRVYEHVLAELGVPAPAVVFVDDKDENIAAARGLGLRTVHHVPGIDLAAELAV